MFILPIFILFAIFALVGAAISGSPKLGHARRFNAPLWFFLIATLVFSLLGVLNDSSCVIVAASVIDGILFGLLLCTDPSRERSRAAGILRELAENVRLNMPLKPYLEALMLEHRGEMVLRLQRSAFGLAAGCSLSDALARGHLLFLKDQAVIRAGESGGGGALARTLDQAARSLQRERTLMHRAWLSILYPISTFLLVLPLACFLQFFLFDHFNHYFSRRYHGEDLPQFWERWNVVSACLVTASCLAVFLALVIRASMPNGAPTIIENLWAYSTPLTRWLHARLPLFGSHWSHACLARASRTLGALTAAGVPLQQALRLTAESALAGPHAQTLAVLADQTERGVSLREGLALTHLPASFQALLLNGAEAGALPEALETAAEWHEARAHRLENLLCVLLPCVTIPLVGCFVAAFYVPFLAALSKMSSHLPALDWRP